MFKWEELTPPQKKAVVYFYMEWDSTDREIVQSDISDNLLTFVDQEEYVKPAYPLNLADVRDYWNDMDEQARAQLFEEVPLV